MNIKAIFLIFFVLLFRGASGQDAPTVTIRHSRLLATSYFVQQLTDSYPDNAYKTLFRSSRFYTPYYIALVQQLDSLDIYESYRFRGYPTGQKQPVATTSLIDRCMIGAASVGEFKNQAVGIIANDDLLTLAHALSALETVYDSLVYYPHKAAIEQQLKALQEFVQTADVSNLFRKGLAFYGSPWDNAIPITIAVMPSVRKDGVNFKSIAAFANHAICEVDINYKDNGLLFSILMSEMYKNMYDGQSRELKLQLESWFKNHTSPNSQYAALFLDDVLATALGCGYVYEQLQGEVWNYEWYAHDPYVNLIAKALYPLVKEYAGREQTIDRAFTDRYIALYDHHFAARSNEPDHLFTHRYVMADDAADLNFFSEHYGFAGFDQSLTPVNQYGLEQLRATPVTKVIIVTAGHDKKLALIKAAFPELKAWRYRAGEAFVYGTVLDDKTRLIVINKYSETLDSLLQQYFKNGKVE